MKNVVTKTGIIKEARLVKEYAFGKLMLLGDETLMICDDNNKEIDSLDISDFVQRIK